MCDREVLAFAQGGFEAFAPRASPPTHQKAGQISGKTGMPDARRPGAFLGPTEKQPDAEPKEAAN